MLEAGLRPEQAAALEWRDLAVDANERPTITIQRGSPGAGTVFEISKRAHDDLRTIASKSAEAGKWIFGLNAAQINARIRTTARVAGMVSRIEGAAPRQGTPGVTAVSSTSTGRVREGYWRAFRAWCDERGEANLPACAETVAEYLREGQETGTLHTLRQRRYVIRKKTPRGRTR